MSFLGTFLNSSKLRSSTFGPSFSRTLSRRHWTLSMAMMREAPLRRDHLAASCIEGEESQLVVKGREGEERTRPMAPRPQIPTL